MASFFPDTVYIRNGYVIIVNMSQYLYFNLTYHHMYIHLQCIQLDRYR